MVYYCFSIFVIFFSTQSILYATYSVAVSSVARGHVRIAAVEIKVTWVVATNRTAPIDAVGTNTTERTTAVNAEARRG